MSWAALYTNNFQPIAHFTSAGQKSDEGTTCSVASWEVGRQSLVPNHREISATTIQSVGEPSDVQMYCTIGSDCRPSARYRRGAVRVVLRKSTPHASLDPPHVLRSGR